MKCDLAYFLAIFFLMKCEKTAFYFVKHENALFFKVQHEI